MLYVWPETTPQRPSTCWRHEPCYHILTYAFAITLFSHLCVWTIQIYVEQTISRLSSSQQTNLLRMYIRTHIPPSSINFARNYDGFVCIYVLYDRLRTIQYWRKYLFFINELWVEKSFALVRHKCSFDCVVRITFRLFVYDGCSTALGWSSLRAPDWLTTSSWKCFVVLDPIKTFIR